jgi:hypothetical protein
MEVLGYITVAVLAVSGGWLIWRNRRQLRARATPVRVSIDRYNRRLRGYVGFGMIVHAMVIGLSLWQARGCLHERPAGAVVGTGETIVQGQIATNLQKLLEQQVVQKQQEQQRRQVTRESLLQVLREKKVEVTEDEQQERQRAVDSVGIPTELTRGTSAAGSPFGTRVGGELWLYRVKHSGASWDANPKALPVLLQEVKKAFPNLKVANRQEVITLDELPRHKGKHFPSFLFFTGTGAVHANDQQKRNLREYLQAGGFIVADSSGGDFEEHFKRFIREVYGRGRVRSIEFDHEVFRGEKVLYQLSHGCPVYRTHGRQEDAEGMFDRDGRLMVFISPGDLGSAWASVAMGRSRTSVERAFQMGTNLVSWSLNTVRDTREEKK